MTQYTHTSPDGSRTWRLYGCAKRGCDAVNPDYWSYGVGWPNEKSYCLHHVPWRIRIRRWLGEDV